jgi:hypothetical protein
MSVDNIIALKQVEIDIAVSEKFYNKQNANLGSYFRSSIVSDIESLIVYAGIHQKHRDLYRLLATKFPYAIYYDIVKHTIIIYAVLDTRSNPKTINSLLNSRMN